MFEMIPYFVVEPIGNGRAAPLAPPYMAMVERIVKVADADDSYLCRLAEIPGLPNCWCMAILRLEGVAVPGDDFMDNVRAEAVKVCVERRLLGVEAVTLREFRRDASSRLLADVHSGHCNLSALLSELVREE